MKREAQRCTEKKIACDFQTLCPSVFLSVLLSFRATILMQFETSFKGDNISV